MRKKVLKKIDKEISVLKAALPNLCSTKSKRQLRKMVLKKWKMEGSSEWKVK